MRDWDSLKEALACKLGISCKLLTDARLSLIIRDLSRCSDPGLADWMVAANRHVPMPRHRRLIEGEDMSDLNMLLFQILNQGGSPPQRPSR